MATIDMADYLGADLPMASGYTLPFKYVDKSIDLTVAATEKGSAIAAADVIQALDFEAGSVILAAGFQVETVNAGSTVMTLDLGVTGGDVDNFVDGFDFIAAIDNEYSAQPVAYAPVVIGNTADTLDILIASLSTTNTAGIIRVWAIYSSIRALLKPGRTALGS